jgi:hypothetical protein
VEVLDTTEVRRRCCPFACCPFEFFFDDDG